MLIFFFMRVPLERQGPEESVSDEEQNIHEAVRPAEQERAREKGTVD